MKLTGSPTPPRDVLWGVASKIAHFLHVRVQTRKEWQGEQALQAFQVTMSQTFLLAMYSTSVPADCAASALSPTYLVRTVLPAPGPLTRIYKNLKHIHSILSQTDEDTLSKSFSGKFSISRSRYRLFCAIV